MRISFDLAPEACNGPIDEPGQRGGRIVPDLDEQFVPVDGGALPDGEVVKQLEFLVRERDLTFGVERAQAHEVDRDIAEDELFDIRMCAPKHRTDAGDDFLEVK